MAEIDYKNELAAAYRCIRGLYGKIAKGETPDRTVLGYHSLAIAAAARFIHEGAMDGTAHFIGKPIEELHKAMEYYK